MVADILQVSGTSAVVAHRSCCVLARACCLLLLLLTRARADSWRAGVCHDLFARFSQELQGRLEKAILEYVILQGSSSSPL